MIPNPEDVSIVITVTRKDDPSKSVTESLKCEDSYPFYQADMVIRRLIVSLENPQEKAKRELDERVSLEFSVLECAVRLVKENPAFEKSLLNAMWK